MENQLQDKMEKQQAATNAGAAAEPKPKVNLWELFKSTFLISAFTVGGGYVIVPLLKATFVDKFKWLDEKESLDLVSIAQTAPGVVAVNASVIMGYRMGGVPGLLTAALATVLPPLFTISLLAYFYNEFVNNQAIHFMLEGMQCGATALIVDVLYNLLKKELKKGLALPIAIMVGTFAASNVFNLDIMYIVLANAVIGLLLMQDKKYC